MSTGTKLIVGVVVITCATGYMAYLGASTSWQYYLTVDECMNRASSMTGRRLRVSGRVAADSLRIAQDRMHTEFVLQGQKAMLSDRVCGPAARQSLRTNRGGCGGTPCWRALTAGGKGPHAVRQQIRVTRRPATVEQNVQP